MRVLTGKRQYLDAMGIDVWSVRPDNPAPVQPSSGHSPMPDLVKAIGAAPEPHKKAPPPKQEPAQEAPVAAEVPQFRFALLHYGSLGVCVSLGESDSLPRRFCDDLARVMGAEVDSVRYQELKWPMLNTSGIDQSVNAAREFVTQKFRALPTRVVVIGEDVAEYFGPLRDLGTEPKLVGNQSYLMIPSMAQTAASADIKRSLFVSLVTWRETR